MNPFTIAIVNLKRGVAKTTTAISLADLFGEQVGKTLLLDLDRQASAMEWAETVSGEGSEIAAAVEQLPADAPPARLARLINEAGQGYEWLIIDSPPGDMDRFEAAVEAVAVNGGLVLIPTGTGEVDLPRAVVTMEDIGDRARKFVLLTKTRANTIAVRKAREDLASVGARVLDSEIPLRESIANAASRGLAEAKKLYEPVAEELFERIEAN